MESTSALDIRSEGNVAIARFKGHCICDVEQIANASTGLKQYIEAHQPSALIFDFDGVKFFSSQVLGILLEARARLRPHDGRVAVSGLTSQLERVFRITNLDQLFTLHADLPAAMTTMSGDRAGMGSAVSPK
jgi:anti-sigma B factor antagonist